MPRIFTDPTLLEIIGAIVWAGIILAGMDVYHRNKVSKREDQARRDRITST